MFPAILSAQKFYTYVGDIGPDFVLLAWGHAEGSNTIGRSSPRYEKVTVKLGDQTLTPDKNWVILRNLTPDTDYSYEVTLNGNKIGSAKVRTWPAKSEKLCFFVIGDWGTGKSSQYQVADAMWKEFEKRLGSDCPVRFLLTTGDNIYGQFGFSLRFRNTGDSDREWAQKFFQPYERLLARVPFYPTLGNHDGNETESRGDLGTYLDNFLFPQGSPSRYYRFSYGGLADFFALDSTENTERGGAAPQYLQSGDQYKWLVKNISESQVPWKIPYFHHPPFSAGPRHAGSLRELAHFIEVFKNAGVKVAFSGHEHNFQMSEQNDGTSGIRFLITGAGGELRTSDVYNRMESEKIAGWAPQLHFLACEIEGKEMRVNPLSFQPVKVVSKDRKPVEMPVRVKLP